METLEDRRLMSGTFFHSATGSFGHHHGHGGGHGASILFSQLPLALQTDLTTLAGTDGLAAPTASESVALGNSHGIESYSITLASSTTTGTSQTITIDPLGDAITAPTQSTTTFGALTNTAVTGEISAIALGLGLTAPVSTTVVNVSTPTLPAGPAIYTVSLPSSSSAFYWSGDTISVDASGNAVGNERIPLSAAPAAVQTALGTTDLPTGATAPTVINVESVDGVTLYTANYSSTGTQSSVTVSALGALTSLPSASQVLFSSLPAAAATELQVLATADGVSGTIGASQTVTAYAEPNGTTIYSVTLAGTTTATATVASTTYNVTLAVDQLGNPTVVSNDDFGFGGFGGGGPGGGGCNGGFGGPGGGRHFR